MYFILEVLVLKFMEFLAQNFVFHCFLLILGAMASRFGKIKLTYKYIDVKSKYIDLNPLAGVPHFLRKADFSVDDKLLGGRSLLVANILQVQCVLCNTDEKDVVRSCAEDEAPLDHMQVDLD